MAINNYTWLISEEIKKINKINPLMTNLIWKYQHLAPITKQRN